MVSREVASGTARPQKMYVVSERAKPNVGSRGASATRRNDMRKHDMR